MKEAIMTAPGKITFADVPAPDIKPDEVLVKMIRIGICGSDIHVFHGTHPYTSYPVVQGHEVSGVIEKVGAEVTEYRKGDHVTIQPQLVCGTCYACSHGSYHICDNLKVMGFQTTPCVRIDDASGGRPWGGPQGAARGRGDWRWASTH